MFLMMDSAKGFSLNEEKFDQNDHLHGKEGCVVMVIEFWGEE